MEKYRKKPIVIETLHYTGTNVLEALAFTGKHPNWNKWFTSEEQYVAHVRADRGAFRIITLEGVMEAMPGDYIIKGVNGEFYPCKPDIFEKTYEKVV